MSCLAGPYHPGGVRGCQGGSAHKLESTISNISLAGQSRGLQASEAGEGEGVKRGQGGLATAFSSTLPPTDRAP